MRRAGLGLLLAGAVLSGCTHITLEVGRPLTTPAEHFRTGETRHGDVLLKLGPPTRIAARPGGFVFLYEYARVHERQLGLSGQGEGSGLVNVVFARGHARREAHLLSFDDDGVLRSQRRKSREESLGGGFGVQLVVDVSNTLDTSAFRSEPLALGWGAGLLLRLPEALNARHGPPAGRGVSLLGSPGGIGQESLDLRRR